MVWAPRCQHMHAHLYGAIECQDARLQWLYRKPTDEGDMLDLGRLGAFLSLRQSGTATGPENELAEERRRSAEREMAVRFVWGDPRNVGLTLALGSVCWGAYMVGLLIGNFFRGRGRK